ncbi:MAG: Eco57I restriction-modification methylase domain-containing protein [Chloroflexi bacterium]|nr:Eco57I restriction-modification methylase domain-containing protein [Chloroflexota bacterium]
MTLSTERMRACLQTFDFKRLFVEELGWNNYSARLTPAEVDGVRCTFAPIAEQGGMVVVTCTADDGNIPPSGARRKIDQHVTDLAFEHLIIFLDRDSKGTAQTSLWWWVKREEGAIKPRTFTYRRGMLGDALLQKLAGIAFAIEDLDDEGQVSIATVTSRVKKAFDVETVTKKFYDQFKTEHTAFLKFLTGLPDGQPRDWYASVMLNRLMFLYFIQKKRFLNDDPDYLRTKLETLRGAGQNFYRDFLVILFFDGLACEEGERDAATNRLLGKIPYLNGGLFLPHSLEDQYGEQIAIADEAFERLFNFFDGYTWHLDDRPLRQGNEINPDVLGYIFEKYINQKQMGAYYTKEDITGYICRSTILPFLLDKVDVDVRAILTDVEPYIYDAVATEDYLPTETEREYAARRARYAQIQADFAAGKIATVDDLVTYNLDMQTLVEDWLRGLSDPVLLRRFYFECLLKLTVLDPTAGSGAFLFAAINSLEPLYELALDKMRQMVGAPEEAPVRPNPRENVVKYLDFVDELQRVSAHPNRRYFVLKSIIVNNLYGVDIMDEAVEICKLRLFLKMVAQVDSPAQIEPLPDIDFNIRAGNTLVGFATRGEIEGRLFATEALKRKVEEADRALRNFRDLQTRIGVEASVFKGAKAAIHAQLAAIRADLDQSLMDDYGLTDLDAFRASHKPFHWYVEFNSVLANGGFDVIVGNPPYVESNKVKEYEIRNYESEPSHNLYAYTMERAVYIQRQQGRFSVIVPVGAFSVNETVSLRALLNRTFSIAWLSGYGIRPSKLFDGVDQRLSIYIGVKQSTNESKVYSSKYHHWYSEEREDLFERLTYQDVSRLGASGVFPKAGDPLSTGIIEKVRRQAKPIGAYLVRANGFKMHYHRSPRYWIRAMDFEQHFRSATRTRSIHHFRDLYAINTEMGKFVGAVLNSSLFFFWFLTVGNGRNLTGDDVKDFFVGTPTPDVVKETGEIFDRLMVDYRNNSVIRVRKDQEYQEFDQSASKPIIDEIDRVLARHYGFTEAELDFIINYDIKYRMGRDAESDGDEGVGE